MAKTTPPESSATASRPKKTGRLYSPKLKKRVLARIFKDKVPISQVAKEEKLKVQTLYGWRLAARTKSKKTKPMTPKAIKRAVRSLAGPDEIEALNEAKKSLEMALVRVTARADQLREAIAAIDGLSDIGS